MTLDPKLKHQIKQKLGVSEEEEEASTAEIQARAWTEHLHATLIDAQRTEVEAEEAKEAKEAEGEAEAKEAGTEAGAGAGASACAEVEAEAEVEVEAEAEAEAEAEVETEAGADGGAEAEAEAEAARRELARRWTALVLRRACVASAEREWRRLRTQGETLHKERTTRWMGGVLRRAYAASAEREWRRHQAAGCLQSRWRCVMACQRVSSIRAAQHARWEQEVAATKLQASWRGKAMRLHSTDASARTAAMEMLIAAEDALEDATEDVVEDTMEGATVAEDGEESDPQAARWQPLLDAQPQAEQSKGSRELDPPPSPPAHAAVATSAAAPPAISTARSEQAAAAAAWAAARDDALAALMPSPWPGPFQARRAPPRHRASPKHAAGPLQARRAPRKHRVPPTHEAPLRRGASPTPTPSQNRQQTMWADVPSATSTTTPVAMPMLWRGAQGVTSSMVSSGQLTNLLWFCEGRAHAATPAARHHHRAAPKLQSPSPRPPQLPKPPARSAPTFARVHRVQTPPTIHAYETSPGSSTPGSSPRHRRPPPPAPPSLHSASPFSTPQHTTGVRLTENTGPDRMRPIWVASDFAPWLHTFTPSGRPRGAPVPVGEGDR